MNHLKYIPFSSFLLVAVVIFFPNCTNKSSKEISHSPLENFTYNLKEIPKGIDLFKRIFKDTSEPNSLLVLRIGKTQCEKCINEFVSPVFNSQSNVPFEKILFLVSTVIPSDMLYFKKKYGNYGEVLEFPQQLPLDSLGLPYLFLLNNEGKASSHLSYGLNTEKEILLQVKELKLSQAQVPKRPISLWFEDSICKIPIVRVNETYNAHFQYKNISSKRTKILKIETECGCTVAEWDSGYIKPGQAGEIGIKITASHTGLFYKKCKVFEEDIRLPKVLVIKSELPN